MERSGGVSGKTVLITGGGTIGQMILLLATAYGATQVVVSDVKPFARSFASEQGATATLDPTAPDCADQAATLAPDGFEVVFEAAGVPAALNQAFNFSARGATVVQVGTLPDGTEIPANFLLTRELTYTGSWRFANVFNRVINLIVSGRIDVRSLITRSYPFEQLGEAINDASSAEAIKVQIELNS